MDCRSSVCFCVVALVGIASGCAWTRNEGAQASQFAQNPEVPPPGAVIQKPKESRRPPLPATVVALAVLKERETTQTSDPAVQMKLRDEARVYYQQALKIDPNHRDALAGLARMYSLMGEQERAVETLRAAMKKYSKDAGLWFELGMCHNRTKDFDKACQCLKKSLELDPENRQTMQTLGFTLARAGQIDEAVFVLTRAEGVAAAHYHVGRMMHHVGRGDEARRHLELALRENPNLEQAGLLLAALEEPAEPGVAGNPVPEQK